MVIIRSISTSCCGPTPYYVLRPYYQIMGTMNAILPIDNIPFDVDEFSNLKSMEHFEMPVRGE